ncbi:uncharacterized protein EV420DRAFT_1485196 [Desarmillaria tabescens]|uniref:Peptidase S53 activation domain-containing protein n=1 Tax=Armillaria tabescens TaxID=1929756 RepID=A0AA39JHC0_ARMTA|nr:uncharacterized protein EV420DRAFT_1485196 [Desarmillaria tabescens]KAK0442776.1 hypothetical protein EV420DRAFT_1485196 [Desarmillaria tabescens]
MFGVIPLSVQSLPWCLGVPLPVSCPSHDQRDAAPNRFVLKADAADPQVNLNFRIGLTPKDIAGLEKALYDPDNDLYGQHLSFEEVKTFSAANSEAVTAVTGWLADNGVNLAPPTHAQYENFVHTDTGDTSYLIRTLTASTPSDLVDFVEVVYPTTSFGRFTFGPKSMVSIPNLTKRANPAPLLCNNVIVCKLYYNGIPTTRATNHLVSLLRTLDGSQNPQGRD